MHVFSESIIVLNGGQKKICWHSPLDSANKKSYGIFKRRVKAGAKTRKMLDQQNGVNDSLKTKEE